MVLSTDLQFSVIVDTLEAIMRPRVGWPGALIACVRHQKGFW